MVEVIPKFEERGAIEIPPAELRVELSRAGGPGGQNVNKRENRSACYPHPDKSFRAY